MDIKKIEKSKNPYVEYLIQCVHQNILNNLRAGGVSVAVQPKTEPQVNVESKTEPEPELDPEDDVAPISSLFDNDDDDWA